jgi:hypothetical protein
MACDKTATAGLSHLSSPIGVRMLKTARPKGSLSSRRRVLDKKVTRPRAFADRIKESFAEVWATYLSTV